MYLPWQAVQELSVVEEIFQTFHKLGVQDMKSTHDHTYNSISKHNWTVDNDTQWVNSPHNTTYSGLCECQVQLVGLEGH